MPFVRFHGLPSHVALELEEASVLIGPVLSTPGVKRLKAIGTTETERPPNLIIREICMLILPLHCRRLAHRAELIGGTPRLDCHRERPPDRLTVDPQRVFEVVCPWFNIRDLLGIAP